MNIQTIGIVGCGFMGKGIIHSFAEKDFQIVAVTRRDNDKSIYNYLQDQLKKGNITEENYKNIKSNIKITTDIKELYNCQLVIECINENKDDKQAILKIIDKICDEETIIASNTSSISISLLANSTKRADKVIGLHFMSPVATMKLVEIIKGTKTSNETIKIMNKLIEKITKIPIIIKDCPGFVSSRLVAVIINEAAYILMQGIADVRSIDNIAKLGMNLPVGPLKLADEIGLDVVENVVNSMYENCKNDKYKLAPIIKEMVNEGNLGRKTGKGFYLYN